VLDELLRSVSAFPEPWNAAEIVLNVAVSFALGLFIAAVYRGTRRHGPVSHSFLDTLVLLAMIMAVVMMVIGNSIARAFGLAGAMSIIRFRTVVKDVRDTAFVFFSLGAGMASGTGNLKIAALGTLSVGLLIGVLHWTRHGAAVWNECILTFERVAARDEAERTVHRPVFDRYLRSHRLIGVRSLRMGEFQSMSYLVELRDLAREEDLVRDLAALEGLQRVTLVHGEETDA
jgi:hypothetical protein